MVYIPLPLIKFLLVGDREEKDLPVYFLRRKLSSKSFRTARMGRKIKIFKFGTFSVAELGEREGRDPRTGVSVVIPARRRCLYHQSITFKRELNA